MEAPQTISPQSHVQDAKAEPSVPTSIDAEPNAQHIQGQDVLQQDLNGVAHSDCETANGMNSTQVQASQGQSSSQTGVLVHSDIRAGDSGAVSIATLVPQELAVQGHIVLAQYVLPAAQNQTEEMISRDGSYLSLGGSFHVNQSQWTGQIVQETGIKNPSQDTALMSASALMLQEQSGQASQKNNMTPGDAHHAKLISMQVSPSQQVGKVVKIRKRKR